MNLLQVTHSERPRRYFINGRRVSRDHYHDAISTAQRSGRSQNSFQSTTTHHVAGGHTLREHSCI